MLKNLKDNDLTELLAFCKGSILGTRIACYALSYGFDKDFLVYWGNKKEGQFNCIAAKFENTLTVLTEKDADFEEMKEFVDVIGADSVVTSEFAADALNFGDYDIKKGFRYIKEENSLFSGDNANEDDLREIYALISKAIPNSFTDSKEAYLSFLSDFTYRQRRGYSKAKCIHHDGKVVSSAITAAQSDTDALISGVACDEEYRKYGYGKRTVLSLVSELKNEDKDVYVIALNSSAEGFYEHIGFEECEKIAFIERRVKYV